ncbi:MAG: succinate dehydrogenase / fumarate reductase, cytochrome b subunit [Tenuifilum sp.]|jgi:succinate dehydrogenase / fumarate reductase cytochrome b subunit|uniref:succinate dehydrogenase cytochrome b subunit n=1 Tax=Tenuifilum sp. TaxID=2760880 RepID=UPI0024AC4928|nr:succinate dehydrogenase cytochrome b subunit [Tenuifilum sp.]MDI3526597.1 succinate dehydrogenase / fumarate reductase, cytochrome b subunit [Tenuifilum sp.]
MIEIFNSSIGKKLIMSITGVFLMLFLLVHLTVNLMLLVGDGEVFNRAAHFMATNPAIKIIEPLLAIGFVFHIIYATYLTIKNRKTRPIGYSKSASNGVSSWSSKNMYILGATILIFLVIHLANFFWKIKFGTVDTITYGTETMHNTYALVAGLFISYWWYDLLYVLGAIFLGLHLSHGFWSAFQTLGWNGTKWLKRLEVIAYIYAIIIGLGFSIIPLYFLIFK